MTTKVKAEDLPSYMTSDHITLYFERYGEIKDSVEMLEGEQSAIISFEEPGGMVLFTLCSNLVFVLLTYAINLHFSIVLIILMQQKSCIFQL